MRQSSRWLASSPVRHAVDSSLGAPDDDVSVPSEIGSGPEPPPVTFTPSSARTTTTTIPPRPPPPASPRPPGAPPRPWTRAPAAAGRAPPVLGRAGGGPGAAAELRRRNRRDPARRGRAGGSTRNVGLR